MNKLLPAHHSPSDLALCQQLSSELSESLLPDARQHVIACRLCMDAENVLLDYSQRLHSAFADLAQAGGGEHQKKLFLKKNNHNHSLPYSLAQLALMEVKLGGDADFIVGETERGRVHEKYKDWTAYETARPGHVADPGADPHPLPLTHEVPPRPLFPPPSSEAFACRLRCALTALSEFRNAEFQLSELKKFVHHLEKETFRKMAKEVEAETAELHGEIESQIGLLESKVLDLEGVREEVRVKVGEIFAAKRELLMEWGYGFESGAARHDSSGVVGEQTRSTARNTSSPDGEIEALTANIDGEIEVLKQRRANLWRRAEERRKNEERARMKELRLLKLQEAEQEKYLKRVGGTTGGGGAGGGAGGTAVGAGGGLAPGKKEGYTYT
eukprot:g3343.t1